MCVQCTVGLKSTHANYMPLFNNEGYKEIYKRVTFTKCAVLFNDNFRLVLENICILAIF